MDMLMLGPEDTTRCTWMDLVNSLSPSHRPRMDMLMLGPEDTTR